MSRAGMIAGALTLSTLVTGCAETFARGSTRGAVAAVHASGKAPAIVEGATRAGTAGALDVLTAEERREALTSLTRDVANAMAGGVRGQLSDSIEEGERPLAEAIRRVSQSALFPSCAQAADRDACTQAMLRGMTRSAATEVAGVMREQLALPMLILAFVAGVLCALSTVFVVAMLRTRRLVHDRTRLRPA